MDEHMLAIEVHACLHRFRATRGSKTGITEAKLVQQCSFIKQVPLHGIFVDLHKNYNAIGLKRVIDILHNTGVGPKALCFIVKFWERAHFMCQADSCYGLAFMAKRNTTQEAPLPPIIFNLVVDITVCTQLIDTTGTIDITDIRHLLVCFYENDCLSVACNPTLFQQTCNTLADLFNRVGLETKTRRRGRQWSSFLDISLTACW
jgi:hypothetical protein